MKGFTKFQYAAAALLLALSFYAFDTFGPRTDAGPATANDFVNFETPHVFPLDITPNQQKLLAVNTADNRLEVYEIQANGLTHLASIPVGMDPVTVRARNNNQAWVVNHLSDNISVIDLNQHLVIQTLSTDNEPCDVVFASGSQRAFVTCSEANAMNVFNLNNLNASPQKIVLKGEEPRSLAISPDGNTVYAGFFMSGNQTTIVPGGKIEGPQDGRSQDAVRHPAGPYGGVDVPPNDGSAFNPPIAGNLPPPPPVSLIVRKNAQGEWLDDNNGDWTPYISGNLAAESHRIPGWDLPDRDVAVLNANNLSVSYQTQLMNILMALSVNPSTGEVSVVGTDATNEIRFEPNLVGRFMRVNWAKFQNGAKSIKDMNTHLDYSTSTVSQSLRNRSVSDPRGIAWNNAGTQCFVTGMGSDNLIILDQDGNRLTNQPIEVGEGPTGIALHETSARAFVMNKFSGSISIVNMNSQTEMSQVTFYDPTPEVIKAGRPHLYNSHENSGLGHISCASCHIDARTDRLAWDLGDPQGELTFPAPGTVINGAPFNGFHPMKGPLRTQTLQDIIRYPTMHWRGDRTDLFDFADAYRDLQGTDAPKPQNEMEEFNAFLSTIHFAPNPYRNLDNSISNSVPIFGPNNAVLSTVNPNNVIPLFQSACLSCHPGHRGRIADLTENFLHVETHQVPETFRGFYERSGFFSNTTDGNTQGYGKLPDGAEFFNIGQMTLSETTRNELRALLMSYDGGVPWAEEGDQPSLDAHAAVGKQVTVNNGISGADQNLLNQFLNISNGQNDVGLVAKGIFENEYRSFVYLGNNQYQSDHAEQIVSHAELLADAQASGPMTFTMVPFNTRYRLGIDRDSDGIFDWDEDNGNAPIASNSLTITTDDSYELYFNGLLIGENSIWQTAEIYNQLAIQPGKNVIAIKATNASGPAAVIAELNREGTRLGTNTQWKVNAQEVNGWKEIDFNDNAWSNATDRGGFGDAPWDRNVIGIADDTPARWVWSNNTQSNSSVFLRFSFTDNSDERLDFCNGEVLLQESFAAGLGSWNNTTGTSLQNGGLQISNNAQLQSAQGGNWTDYAFKAKLSIINSSAGLVFRKTNNSNYYYWEFRSDGNLRAEKRVNGNYQLIKQVDLRLSTNTEYEVSILVEGNVFKTYVNNQLVDITTDNAFSTGRVGIDQGCNGCGRVAFFDELQVCSVQSPAINCTWEVQANEDQSFNLPQASLVRYGANGNFYYKMLSGNVPCNNATFGDPIDGTVKSCAVCEGITPQPQAQSISFASIPDRFTTDGNFNLSASASSGLPVSFAVISGPATVVGNTVILDGSTGQVTIRATQNGNANWLPAAAVNRSFDVLDPPDPGDCNTPENVAIGKPSTQSSTKQGGVASRANDGNTNGIFYSQYSVSLTGWEPNAWWEVDLGESYDIESVNLWNRQDCCSEWFMNFYVLVSDVPFGSQELLPTINQSGVSNFYQAGQTQAPSTMSIGRSGRYLRVQLNQTSFLGMAEVEIMGCPAGSNPPPPPPPGNEAPIVNFTSPNDQQSFTAGENASVEVAASDSDGTVSKVDLYFNDVLVRTETGAPYIWNGPGQNDGLLQNLSEGTHVLRAVATDDDGDTAEESISIVVIEQGGPPCNGSTNLALNQPSTQSSTAQGGVAARANDGNSNGVFYSQYSVSLTSWENQAWWEVDLGAVQDIETVNIWNRVDCCFEWLKDAYVLVSDVPFVSTQLNDVLNQSGVSQFFTAGQLQLPTGVNINRSGRYVRVQLLGSSFLGMAEVEVLGCPGSTTQNRLLAGSTFEAQKESEALGVNSYWYIDEARRPSLYTLEHSADGEHFEVIDERVPQGATGIQSYQNTHADPVLGDNHYRLRIDYPSGKFELLKAEVIHFKFTKDLVHIYPNPTVNYVQVDLTKIHKADQEILLQLYDLKGVLVQQKIVAGDAKQMVELAMGELRAGIYTLYVDVPGRKSVGYRIVKVGL